MIVSRASEDEEKGKKLKGVNGGRMPSSFFLNGARGGVEKKKKRGRYFLESSKPERSVSGRKKEKGRGGKASADYIRTLSPETQTPQAVKRCKKEKHAEKYLIIFYLSLYSEIFSPTLGKKQERGKGEKGRYLRKSKLFSTSLFLSTSKKGKDLKERQEKKKGSRKSSGVAFFNHFLLATHFCFFHEKGGRGGGKGRKRKKYETRMCGRNFMRNYLITRRGPRQREK